MKRKDTIYLLDKHPTSGPFLGSKPPTVRDVLQKLIGIHADMQAESSRQSLLRGAIRATANEIVKWWSKTNIEVKSEIGIIKMIEGLHSKWKVLHKQRKKDTATQINNRKDFKLNLSKTFWVVNPD